MRCVSASVGDRKTHGVGAPLRRRVAEEAGCNGFITKPVMPRELKMYLDKYLTK